VNLQTLIARLSALGSTLSRTQLVTLALSFLAVVGLVGGSAYWINAPTYAVLFADMDSESAGGVVAKLKSDKVPFVLEDGGRTIKVAADRVDELRLTFASAGMPASGRIGFEIFDRTAFGVTDFLEHVNYRRALEGELARTIGTITDVAGARVHIAMPQPSLFAKQDQAAKASVVLKLRHNQPLPPSTISAITGLVAASVEGLRPEGVVLIDSFGRPLTASPDAADGTGALRIERQQRIEHELSARVLTLLEPIVGTGDVRVNVSAKLNTDTQEETEERWDPTPVVRSHQSTAAAAAGAGTPGVAGVRGNVPPPPSDAARTPPAPTDPNAPKPAVPTVAAVQQPTNTSETTNYEVSRLTRHRIQPEGEIARLSVAVLVNDSHVPADENGHTTKTRSAEELQKIHDIVAAAVGLDVDRGDRLTVADIPFEEPKVDDIPALPWWRREMPAILGAGRIAAISLIAVLVLMVVIRPAMRMALSPSKLPTGLVATQVPRTVQDMEGQIEAEIDEGDGAGQPRRLPVLTRRVAKLAHQEPENAARMVRSWLVEEER
jgi:flagellar M-ring protein FliF